MAGVILPVLNGYLKESGWRYEMIGAATALAGLGALLFAAGVAQTFFGPLLGALALGLVGQKLLNRTMGVNQGWNHAGNIAAALAAMALVEGRGITSIFYAVGFSSVLATLSISLIRPRDLDGRRATGLGNGDGAAKPAPWRELLHDRTILLLFASMFAFHLANAPILPAVALYVKSLHGSDSLMTATVLTAQIVMAPVARLAGRGGDAWGRKATMAIAFWVLPLRIFILLCKVEEQPVGSGARGADFRLLARFLHIELADVDQFSEREGHYDTAIRFVGPGVGFSPGTAGR